MTRPAEAGTTADHGMQELRQLVGRFVPSWAGREVADDTPLGSSGLGLDSIAIVELLVACEQHFGMSFPDSLLDARPLTVGTLVRHLEQGRTARESA